MRDATTVDEAGNLVRLAKLTFGELDGTTAKSATLDLRRTMPPASAPASSPGTRPS